MSLHVPVPALGLEAFESVLSEYQHLLAGTSIQVGSHEQGKRMLNKAMLKLIFRIGRNPFMDWAKIIDCGDAPLTFLDNTIALKQLEKAHKVRPSTY